MKKNQSGNGIAIAARLFLFALLMATTCCIGVHAKPAKYITSVKPKQSAVACFVGESVTIDIRVKANKTTVNRKLTMKDVPEGICCDLKKSSTGKKTTSYTLQITGDQIGSYELSLLTKAKGKNGKKIKKKIRVTVRQRPSIPTDPYPLDPGLVVTKKPILYLYPEKEEKVTVKLSDPKRITSVYPAYEEGWSVTAEPDGTLTDPVSGRQYYGLYYEAKSVQDYKVEKEGFVIKGEDTAGFLEEKLALLGLSDEETQEFIIYWLPQMERNPYNYIRFATEDEIEEDMALSISPKPETMIRIMMTWKELKQPISIQEQALSCPERKGFTVVEWGGCIIP